MMGRKKRLISGGEMDALTKAKRFHSFKAGVRKMLKRAVNKRARREKVDVKECGE